LHGFARTASFAPDMLPSSPATSTLLFSSHIHSTPLDPEMSTQPSSQHDNNFVVSNFDVIPFNLVWDYINDPV
jgi:hypothetical protein